MDEDETIPAGAASRSPVPPVPPASDSVAAAGWEASGATWGSAPIAAPGIVNDAGLVVADVPCRKCSYNLRGMNVASRCPECGAPVGVSVHGSLLRYSDPHDDAPEGERRATGEVQ